MIGLEIVQESNQTEGDPHQINSPLHWVGYSLPRTPYTYAPISSKPQ